MKENEKCDYDHTLIDDSSAQGDDKENYGVREDNSNKCKDVIIETGLMQSHVANELHEDVELQSELQQAMDVLINERENVEMPF